MSIDSNSQLVKYGSTVFTNNMPCETFLSDQIGKAKSSFDLESKIFWRAGFLLRNGRVTAGDTNMWLSDGHAANLKTWTCTCGASVACEHRIAGAILHRWRKFVAEIPATDIIQWLARSIRGRHGVELQMRVQACMVHRFGVKPTVRVLSYTLDGKTIDIASARVVELDYFTFHRIMQENGIEEGLATEAAGVPHVLYTATYHLRYVGFHDLTSGNFLDVRPAPVKRVTSLSDTHKYWQTTHDLNSKNRAGAPAPIPMTGAS